MKIIIVGCGNVGATLAEQLSKEKHDITVIDCRQQAVEAVTNVCDVMGIIGCRDCRCRPYDCSDRFR